MFALTVNPVYYFYFLDNCSADEILNQTSSTPDAYNIWNCEHLSDSSSCGSGAITYIPTFGDDGYDYCYGSGKFVISPAPTEPYRLWWSSSAWVPFTQDDGSSGGGVSWLIEGKYYDILNSTPSFKLPPIWMIRGKCPGQFIALNPFDADGDKIKCRWATQAEADSAFYRPSYWPSLSIDEDNCIVHYDGTLDSYGQGVKPIALMIEDFDSYGNVKSSTPIQFLAQVWKPNIPTGIATGRSSMVSPRFQVKETENVCWPNCFPLISDDDDDDYYDGRKKRDASQSARSSSVSYTTTTAYTTTTTTLSGSACPGVCTPESVVFIDSAVPLDGAEVDVTSGRFDVTFVATSKNADIAVYTYQGPVGFQCGAIDQAMVSFITL